MVRKPHIVLFNPDQWRGDVLGHIGNPAALTPNLDRLVAEDAVSFSHAFCQNPVCTPSRCSFMSGWYPHVRGHRTMTHMMAPDEPVLLRTLKENGYNVWWGGKNDLVPAENGFDDYCTVKHERLANKRLYPSRGWRGEPGGNTYYSFLQGKLETREHTEGPLDNDWNCIQGAIDYVRQSSGDEPLCLYLPLFYPHPPYGVEDPWFSAIDRSKLPPRIRTPDDWSGKPAIYKAFWERSGLFDWPEEKWDELRATYYGMCARVDYQLGQLIQALKDKGFYDDTALFFFSDHGDLTGDYGLVQKLGNVFPDCQVRVPFIFKPPADLRAKPGICDALVELVDMPATVEELVGLRPGHTHFGKSLLSLATGETEEHRDAVFSQAGGIREDIEDEDRQLPQYSESLYWPQLSILSERGVESTKATMIRTRTHKYVQRLYEQDELYELATDPGELTNRIDDPALADVLAQLKERLLRFYLETGDVVPAQANLREDYQNNDMTPRTAGR